MSNIDVTVQTTELYVSTYNRATTATILLASAHVQSNINDDF